MSEYRIQQDINLFEIANEYAKRLQEHVDELALDMAAETLAKYGYVKVTRCRDCKHFGTRNGLGLCKRWSYFSIRSQPDDFCSRAERRDA